MITANTHRLCGMIVFISLICWSGISYGQETETPDSAKTLAAPIPADDRSKKTSDDESTDFFDSKGLVEKFGDELQEERIAALKDINRQRRETLEYLTQERKAIMTDVEAIGDRIVSKSISESERLIDHLLIRILQVAGVLILAICLAGILAFRFMKQNKNQS